MVPLVPIPLDFLPGVQRDNTPLDAQRALDSLWCRWRGGRPRKMGGYKRITNVLKGLPRNVHMFYSGTNVYIHVGHTGGIHQIVTDLQGNFISSADRTPVTYSNQGTNTDWTIDALFDTATSVVKLVAHVSGNAGSVASTIQTTPFLGTLTGTTALTAFVSSGSLGGGSYTTPSYAGGIACVQPYVFGFDINGLVQWSAPNIPLDLGVTGGTTGAGQAYLSGQKIVAARPVRGGGTQQPAVLLWSLSEVLTGVYIGGTAYFAFSTVSSSSSIISGKSVIEYDGLYYWVGRDRFLVYNGTVMEVPNPQNQDWFFNNLTAGSEQKTYAMKVPRYGEIWWCAPMFGNTEPSHAIIYNVREQCWYDTALPNGGRSAGFSAQGLPFSVMGGITSDSTGYKLWLHETGTDENDSGTLAAVRSYFETPWIGAPKNNPPNEKGLAVQFLEPDFVQTGDMSVYVIGAANARAPVNNGTSTTLKFTPSVPQEQLVGFRESHRILRLHVESNVLGGNYIMGKNLLHAEAGDMRVTS